MPHIFRAWLIRHIAKPQDYSATKLARYLGISSQLVGFWVKGKRRLRRSYLARIKQYLQNIKKAAP